MSYCELHTNARSYLPPHPPTVDILLYAIRFPQPNSGRNAKTKTGTAFLTHLSPIPVHSKNVSRIGCKYQGYLAYNSQRS